MKDGMNFAKRSGGLRGNSGNQWKPECDRLSTLAEGCDQLLLASILQQFGDSRGLLKFKA